MTVDSASLLTAPDEPGARIEDLRAMPLEPWLEIGDPLAEAVVDRLREHRIPPADPLPAIRRLADEGDDACSAFLRDLDRPVSEGDWERMRIGGAMAFRHFPQLLIALTHGGLMTTFATSEAAFIMARTGRLRRDVPRRLLESGALFFGVLDAEALRPGGSAWQTCLHVRLMHTMLRLQLIKTDAWPMAGKPINALHTATGPVFFGSMMLDRLRALGAVISADEADGYYLLWRHVTRLLGVPDGLIGNSAQEQAVLDARILPLCFTPDQNSRDLTQILLDGVGGLPGTERIPRPVHEVLARYMLGDERSDAMGVPPHPRAVATLAALSPGLKLYGWAQRVPPVGRRLEALGRRYLEGLIAQGR